MSEKLTEKTIGELVQAAHTQAAYLIETMLRAAVSDFEGSDSEDFKLVLTVEGQRKRGGGTLTIQTKGQSSIDLKRKDQTPALTIDYGPSLFDEQAKADDYDQPISAFCDRGEAPQLPAHEETDEVPEGDDLEGDGFEETEGGAE